MEPLFSFETDYDMNTFISMARALRKTVRKKTQQKKSYLWGGSGRSWHGVCILWGPKVLTIAAVAVSFWCSFLRIG